MIALAVLVVASSPLPSAAVGFAGAIAGDAASLRRAGVVVETMRDGSTLVFAHVAGARDVSVRFVVRAGGADDPPGKAGLAHLLEHLVFHGTYEEPEGVMFERAWGAGANLNAFTTDLATVYVLDAPKETFTKLAPQFLAMVTSPALPFAEIDREKGVVGAEAFSRPDEMSIEYAVDQLVYPGANGGYTVIGTEKSRAPITIDDVEDFYSQHYVAKNTAVVVAGDIAIEEARDIVEKGLRLPPGVADDRVSEGENPNVPSDVKALSAVTVTAEAHLVDGAKPGACEAAAGVVELHLRKAILAEQTMAADVGAVCHRMRGHEFLIVYAETTSPESSTLPDLMKRVVLSTARAAPSGEERALIERRRRSTLDVLRARPSAFASALAFGIGRSADPFDVAAEKIATPPALSWSGASPVLSSLADANKVARLHFSRFESE